MRPASCYSEREWLEIKNRYADELITVWQQYAPNMNWDNVIGIDTNSPYDNLRMKNLAPNGTIAVASCGARKKVEVHAVGNNPVVAGEQ